jgi:7,8-dihydroneopterin aldolase/epimerase/oxygenase
MPSKHNRNSDKIFVSNLCIYGYHGVREEEERLGQRFYLDICCQVDTRAATAEDNLTKTLSYSDLCALVQRVFSAKRFKLIESLADRIAREILGQYRIVDQVCIRIRKPSAPVHAVVDCAGVEITRERNDILATQ